MRSRLLYETGLEEQALDRLRQRREEERTWSSVRMRRLRGRVRELEEEVDRLRLENAALSSDRGELEEVLTGPLGLIVDDETGEEVPAVAPGTERMVLVPRGVFIAGEDEGQEMETPRHEVEVDGFWIDLYPVTNRQYLEFVEATGRSPPQRWR